MMSDYSETTPLLVSRSSDNVKDTLNSENTDPRAERSSSSCCGPDGLGTRIIALLLMSVVGFGAFFCFDNPGALQSEMKDSLNITTSDFASLYSWYSWPNVILPIIGGYLIDSVLGVRLGTVIFSSLICAGQLMLGLATLYQCFWLMKVSRFLFGVGGESLNMALNTFTVTWFKDKELNMVFGFQLSLSRLGSTVNFLVMEPLFRKMTEHYQGDKISGLGWSLMIAASFTLLSLISSLILNYLDKRREKHSRVTLTQADQSISLADIRDFPPTFWLLCLATLAYYGSIFPFISLAQTYFQTEYGYDEQAANFLVGQL